MVVAESSFDHSSSKSVEVIAVIFVVAVTVALYSLYRSAIAVRASAIHIGLLA
jgi:hypothetical protein